jgi:hypothetical protein
MDQSHVPLIPALVGHGNGSDWGLGAFVRGFGQLAQFETRQASPGTQAAVPWVANPDRTLRRAGESSAARNAEFCRSVVG